VSIKKEDAGFKKTNNRGEGGDEILIAVQERPGFISGNRYDIPKATLPFKKGHGFAVLSQYFPDFTGTPTNDDEPDVQAEDEAA